MKPSFTHVALSVQSIDATVAFYGRFAGLGVVHDRIDGSRVVWLGEETENPDFVLVLIEGAKPASAGPATLLHFGFDVPSREDVDTIADEARAAGVLASEPTFAGPIVGYFCMLQDPDGHWVEFSHGQTIGRHER